MRPAQSSSNTWILVWLLGLLIQIKVVMLMPSQCIKPTNIKFRIIDLVSLITTIEKLSSFHSNTLNFRHFRLAKPGPS